MDILKSKLIGELIGLARATDGNEHLITASSTATILNCLHASPCTDGELDDLLSMVDEVKRKMVPDCFFCANPCGRTSAYDLTLIQQEKEDIQAAKQKILDALLQADDHTKESALYHGLIAVGMDGLTADFLLSIVDEIHT